MCERQAGVWKLSASADRDTITGEMRSISRTLRGGKREASTELAKLAAEYDDPTARLPAAPAKIALTKLIVDRKEAWDGSATTKSSYVSLPRTNIEPAIGRLPIGEFDTRLLDRYCRWMLDEKGLSDSTVRSIYALIRGSLR